jgi:hypothetical protein
MSDQHKKWLMFKADQIGDTKYYGLSFHMHFENTVSMACESCHYVPSLISNNL